MNPKERGLGKGLEALLGELPVAPRAAGGGAQSLPIELIAPGPHQPRQRFDDADIAALAESIRDKGVLQPILVRPDPGRSGRFQIVAGERRWRAAQRAQRHEVPAIVRNLDDRAALEIALIENVQRRDLTPVEEARGYRRLIDGFGATQESIARQVGKSRSHVANTLRLLNLPGEVLDLLESGALRAGHGRALLAAADPVRLANQIVNQGLNVRQAERLGQAGAARRGRRGSQKNADLLALEADLSTALGLKVTISGTGERGELRIAYRKLEQLDEVIRRLHKV